MQYFALTYEVVSDFIVRRGAYREEHLRRVREANERGVPMLAGALGDPPDGALLVFRAESPSPAEAFARTDPYVTEGLVTGWRVRPWNVVVGAEPPRSNSYSPMIERVWSARTTPDKAAAYASYFQRVVLPELAAVAGYRGARLLQRETPASATEVVVVTEWESLDAIRGFAGDDIDRAVVDDEAAALLSEYDRSVRHFEIRLHDPGPG